MNKSHTMISFEWIGPFSFLGEEPPFVFACKEINRQGIYLWAINFEGRYMTFYVGETGKSFYIRLKNHAQSYLSGSYRIYDPEKFLKGEKHLIWQPYSGDVWPDFLRRYKEISKDLHTFLKQLNIFLAPFNVETRVRRRIEAAVSKTIKKQPPPIGTFQGSDIRYARKKSTEGEKGKPRNPL